MARAKKYEEMFIEWEFAAPLRKPKKATKAKTAKAKPKKKAAKKSKVKKTKKKAKSRR